MHRPDVGGPTDWCKGGSWTTEEIVLWVAPEFMLTASHPFVDAVEDLGVGFAVLHQDGSLRYVNRFLADIVDSTTGDMEGRQARCYVDQANHAAFSEQLALRRLGHCEPYDVRLSSRLGHATRVCIFPAPLFEQGTFLGSCGFLLPAADRASSRAVGAIPQPLKAYAFEILTSDAGVDVRGLRSSASVAPRLSHAEQELLQRLTPGKSVEALASELGYGEAHVRRTLQGLYGKHGVRNRIELLGLLNVLTPNEGARS